MKGGGSAARLDCFMFLSNLFCRDRELDPVELWHIWIFVDVAEILFCDYASIECGFTCLSVRHPMTRDFMI